MNYTFDRAALSWLPPPPADFSGRCKILVDTPAPGAEIRRLASYRLDGSGLNRLARVIGRLRTSGTQIDGFQHFKLAIVGDGSNDLIRDALVASAARHGILLDAMVAPFNAAEMSLLDPDSSVHQFKPDAVLLGFTHRAFRHDTDGAFDAEATGAALANESIERFERLIRAVATGCGAAVILQTIPRPSAALFGSIDRRLPATPVAVFNRINDALARLSVSPHVLFDAAALAETVGLDAWHDPAQWHAFKLPFAQRLVPLYADRLACTLAAMRGLTRKCLVLDLDNTLWGGVIGDDGLQGIRLGQGLADGEAFLEIQQLARRLRRRGIVLAVSSKNDDGVARAAFRDHPDMVLSESDITVFQANWQDKAANIQAIARELNIGVDSLVLLDDNPAERELVRQQLPAVAVPELPDDPSLFPDALMAGGYFDAVSYSVEDSQRADMYAARAKAADLRAQTTDLAEFLQSLEMEIEFAPFNAVGRTRISQLINKSNQFNLTTRRYTEAEVQAMEASPSHFTLQVRLKDKFADHGMISVVIGRETSGGIWEIDTWLMSCRVLGRRVEEAVLAEIVEQAASRGAVEIRGRYIASGRNAMVADHYRRLGFQPIEESPAESVWTFKLADFARPQLPFDICHAASP